jgi:hypothetical protein
MTNTAVTWSVSPSSQWITADGVYTAPSSLTDAPSVTVTAVSQADLDKTASAVITFYDSAAGSAATGSGSAYPLTLSWAPSAIYHPAQVDIAVSQDGSNWSAFGSTNSFASDTQDFAVMWGNVTGSTWARYVRWTFTYQGWLFLAELEAIGPP